MPSSRPEIIPHIVNLVSHYAPKSVLDIGMGFGKYGIILREYLELWDQKDGHLPVAPRHWKIRIDGIEKERRFVSRVQRAVYSNAYTGEAQKILPALSFYDLVLLIDVLGENDKTTGTDLLRMALAHTTKVLIATAPLYRKDQTQWGRCDFDDFQNVTYYSVDGRFGIAVIEISPPETNKNAPPAHDNSADI